MALGGGTFTVQNKVLPGTYINFISAAGTSNVFGERGTGCIGTLLDWFDDNDVTVTFSDVVKNGLKIFGHSYTEPQMMFIREFFKKGSKLIVGAVNDTKTKATKVGTTNTGHRFTAKKYGTRGNDIKIMITKNVDNTSAYDVKTYLGTTLVDSKIGITKLTDADSNDFVDIEATTEITTITGAETIILTGGTGDADTSSLTSTGVEKFLDRAERYSFNCFALVDNIVGDNYQVKDNMKNYISLVAEWTKRMRDEVGIKFQSVIYTSDKSSANHEGIVRVPQNFNVKDSNGKEYSSKSLICAWVCGALAGCEINRSLTNTLYDGELVPKEDTVYTQSELEEQLEYGNFVFHYVGDELRVLEDINTFTEVADDKGDVFKSNQTVRVCDQIANDIAAIFNTYYLGKVQNDAAGRSAFKAEIVKHHNKLMDLRAIEDFESDDVTVEQGDTKKSVVVTDNITVVNAMTHLYMTVVVQ